MVIAAMTSILAPIFILVLFLRAETGSGQIAESILLIAAVTMFALNTHSPDDSLTQAEVVRIARL
jgi:hypothetical protein